SSGTRSALHRRLAPGGAATGARTRRRGRCAADLASRGVVGDAGERDAVRARLARVAAPPGGSSSGWSPPSAGWVPAPPGDPPAGDVVPAADEDAPSDDDGPATDGDAIAARRALAAALAAYTAAHGHPLEGADAAAPAR